MASRVNKKFVLVLSVSLVVVIVAITVSVYVASKVSTSEALRIAEAAMVKGDYKTAIDHYGKAMKHSDYANDLQLILKVAAANNLIAVTDVRSAWLHLKYEIMWLNHACRTDPHNETALTRLMELRLRLARDLMHNSAWDAMHQQAKELTDAYPDHVLGLKYRVISQVYRASLGAADPSPEEQKKITDDLNASLRSKPDDFDLMGALLEWHLSQARDMDRPGGDPELAKKLRDEAVALSAEDIKSHADDIRRLIMHSKILTRLKKWDRIHPHLDAMENWLLAQPAEPRLTTDASTLFLMVQSARKTIDQTLYQRAAAIVQASLEKYPESPRLRIQLAELLQYQGQREKAMQLFQETWHTPLEHRPLEFVIRRHYKLRSGIGYLGLQLSQIEGIPHGKEREQQLAQLETELDQIKEEIGDISAVARLTGRISVARGQWTKAVKEFDTAARRGAGSDLRLLLRRAHAIRLTGEWGAAADIYEQILNLNPELNLVREELVRMCLQGRLFERAQRHLEMLLEAKENNDTARRLQIELLVLQEEFDQAAARRAELGADDEPAFAIRLAHLYKRARRQADAIELAQNAFGKHPANVDLLSLLVQLTKDDKQQQLAYIQQSREAGAGSARLKRLTRFVNGELDLRKEMDASIQRVIDAEDDPVVQAIQRHNYYLQRGEQQRAQEELAKVKTDHPLHPMLINILFDEALKQQDWSQAETMAERARDANNGQGADLAQGAFYAGRLNLARRRFEQGIINLRAGLDRRKIYAHGWLLLGSALIEVQEYSAATDAFQTALKQRPNHVAAVRGLVTAHTRLGNNRKALELLREAHQVHPNNYEITNIYLQYELRYGQVQLALKLRQKLVEDQPENLDNRRQLALTLSHLGQHKQAKKVVEQLIADNGPGRANVILQSQVLTRSGQTNGATRVLTQYIQSRGQDATVDDYVIVARQLRSMGSDQRAISAYRQAVQIEDPAQRPATRELAAVLMSRQSDMSEGVQLYQQLWQSDSSDDHVGILYADALMSTRQLDEAESVVKQITSTTGPTAKTLMLSAQIAKQRGEFGEAEADLDAAIEKAPRRSLIHLAKAELLASNPQRLSEALMGCDRALELSPLLTTARTLKARIYRQQGQLRDAIRECETVLRYQPRQVAARLELVQLYRKTNDEGTLKSLLDKSEKLFPQSPIWPREQALRLARAKNQTNGALAKMARAFQLAKSPEILLELVSMQLAADRPDAALKVLRKHASLVKSNPVFQAMRGRAELKKYRHDDALAAFGTALKQAPDFAQFLAVRNQILKAQLNYEETATLIENASADTSTVWAQMVLADLATQYADQEAALSQIEPLAQRISERPAIEQAFFHRTHARTLHLAERYDEACAEYRGLLEIDPHNWWAMNNLAYLLAQNVNKPEEAVTMAEQALKLRPQDPNILDTLGWALFKAGQLTRARDTLETSLNRQEAASTFLHLAHVLLKQDLRPRAIKMLNSAKKLAEQSKDSHTLAAVIERLEALSP